MDDSLRNLLQTIRSASSERDKAVFQLLESNPESIKSAMTFMLKEDEKERYASISPFISQLTPGSAQGRGEAIINLLLLDRFSLPWLEKASVLHPSNLILKKIKEEIVVLESIFELTPVKKVVNSVIDSPLNLTDKLIRATEPIYIYDNIDNDNKKLISLMEINIDTWRNAREELLRIGQSVILPLSESLKYSNRFIQRLALRTLLTFEIPDFLITVTKLLNESDVFVRDEAALAISQLCARGQTE